MDLFGDSTVRTSKQPRETKEFTPHQKAPYVGAGLTPLADRMRPKTLKEFVGQEHLVGEGKLLRRLIESDQLTSLIFWGPPGSGKTTLAQIIAEKTKSHFVKFSAVTAGIADVKKVVAEAQERLKYGKRSILFVDELHRFDKRQQDAFLPHVEDGTIVLIGATTENPSFEIIASLLSRSRVLTLRELTPKEIKIIVERVLEDEEKGLGELNIQLTKEALEFLINAANGDARIALNALEVASQMLVDQDRLTQKKKSLTREKTVTLEKIEESLQKSALRYDRVGEEHYNTISAFIKSLRGSDPDAALYYLARMLEAGEDPLFIARRMVILASEDIGNADPYALPLSVAIFEACERIGLPECQLNLAQCATYLATAPKSNASCTALINAKKDVKKTANLPIPLHIRNAPTKLMKNLGYAKGYKYAHDYEGGFTPQQYLPDKLKGRRYYRPSDRGFEQEIKARLEKWRGRGS